MNNLKKTALLSITFLLAITVFISIVLQENPTVFLVLNKIRIYVLSSFIQNTDFETENDMKVFNQISFCTSTSLNMVETHIDQFTWQTVIPKQSFVYSAFTDNRSGRGLIKLITIVNIKESKNFNLFCYMWYKNSLPPVVVKAKPEPKFGTLKK